MHSDSLKAVLRFLNRTDSSNYGDSVDRIVRLGKVVHHLLTEATDLGDINFSGLFSRLRYLVDHWSMDRYDRFLLHAFYFARKSPQWRQTAHIEPICEASIDILLSKVYHQDIRYQVDRKALAQLLWQRHVPRDVETKRQESIKVWIESIDTVRRVLTCSTALSNGLRVEVAYGVVGINEDYIDLFDRLAEMPEALPMSCHLWKVTIMPKRAWQPKAFVLDADYLLDVTSVSECFGAFGVQTLGYILRRLMPVSSSQPLLVGNVANFFLDQLVYAPDLQFKDLLTQIFHIDALYMSTCSDEVIRAMLSELEQHFKHIKSVVKNEFATLALKASEAYIEPSFYSPKFGVQGRLDLLFKSDTQHQIIELKSGKIYRPNKYGLNNNHYHQTLLYDMLLESTYGKDMSRNAFILYAKEDNKCLRHAPTTESQKYEIIKMRNELVIIEHAMRTCEDWVSWVLAFGGDQEAQISGYLAQNWTHVKQNLHALTTLERRYVHHAFQFVLREHRLAKVGDDAQERVKGLASLWQDDTGSKVEKYNILNALTIYDNRANQDEAIIVFQSSRYTCPLSNFRVGDLGILYGTTAEGDAPEVLQDQVFKCTVLTLDRHSVTVRLRSRQQNLHAFDSYPFWNIEHDVLDNGFHAMTRSIFEFVVSSTRYRNMILQVEAPRQTREQHINIDTQGTTTEQEEIIKRILAAQDYFLLWGPPGTGKTSVILRHLIQIMYQGGQTLLVAAYTNRAVDEICHGLAELGLSENYIRIGSRYATHADFQSRLLVNITAQSDRRSVLKEKILNTRIYVGTIASLLSKATLFDIVKFDCILMDEASQILEPGLIGILSRAPKFVLIGDHKQLPAVVAQDRRNTMVQEKILQNQGIENFGDSLFERMYRRAMAMGWTHAFAQLSCQGRQHEQLMDITNQYFYQNKLQLLPHKEDLLAPQIWQNPQEKWMNQRLVYCDVETDWSEHNFGINRYEAQQVVSLITRLRQQYDIEARPFHALSIGVITPYRSQIACIEQLLLKTDIKDAQRVTIDTVERYQGGARDIIILSTCLNHPFQLNTLISPSADGIDRKLNVAFTRARQQFILVGNSELLTSDPVYRAIMDRAYSLRPAKVTTINEL